MTTDPEAACARIISLARSWGKEREPAGHPLGEANTLTFLVHLQPSAQEHRSDRSANVAAIATDGGSHDGLYSGDWQPGVHWFGTHKQGGEDPTTEGVQGFSQDITYNLNVVPLKKG